jgi:hypothetical protein
VRHLGGFVIGLVGALFGLALLSLGLGRAVDALRVLELGAGRLVAALLLLLGGLVLGAVVAARRLSPAAPLTGGALLLLLSLIDLAAPRWLFELGLGGGPGSLGYGLSILFGYQISIVPAAILLVSTLAGSRAPAAAPMLVGPPVYPPWGYTPPR